MAPTRTKASSVGQPSQPAQSSRKGKKAWRKNIDLTSTEAFLEEQRDPLRQTASDALFVEDRSGQETLTARQARGKRPLKSLEILQRNFGHAAVAPAKKQKQAAGVDRRMEQRLRKMVGRQQVGTQGDASAIVDRSANVVNKTLGDVYDVWGSSSGDAKGKAKADDWIPTGVAKPAVHVPKTLRRDDFDVASKLPAVELPHPGSSYNPDLESHEALINEAYEIEKRLEENEQMDQAERTAWQSKLATIVAREAELRAQKDDDLKRYRGMDVDVPGLGSDDEAAAEDDLDDASSDDEGAESAEPKRKTRQQRVRAKRARMQQLEAARRKQARIEAAAILQLPALKRRQARLAAARAQAAEARKLEKTALLERKGLAGHKVGKHKVPQQQLDVQTPDELADSLRTLKPEGNLFRDRYTRLQSRGVIEPRVKQTPKRRTHKLKAYETHDYKKFS
ncbi:p60-like protein [Moesziomyces antarcticus]|uniref:Related to Glioma tumor suppressor candidate region gene 2 protein n=2 Tax=Pseudozyma antarctica TaxID=84753 RepID=A0A5C3FUU0_PSEA2|nr:p60-like protein [Moesziomyces antarcticus]GAK67316.1 p60-like protein [Moesziomyces antarcticus]SPO48072.1 related to Glioma tumor suppressor candidate region gene 2 protein [Moesziomyces antarcticus]